MASSNITGCWVTVNPLASDARTSQFESEHPDLVNMEYTDNEMNTLIIVQEQFIQEHDVMRYANGCGVGIGSSRNSELGLTLYFESQEHLESFPFKDERYNGVIVYRIVSGKITPQ